MIRLSKEELKEQVKNIEAMLPMNECILTPTSIYFDPYTQQREIMEEYNRNQHDLIQNLKMQVEDLTRVVNVLAQVALKHPARKFNPDSKIIDETLGN